MLNHWGKRWNIPAAAIAELITTLGTGGHKRIENPRLESDVQNNIRLKAGRDPDLVLWRNNIGACKSADGRFIRFGLANDSAQVNQLIKSADLIGIRRILVSPDMIGRYVGQFVSIECKRADWVYRGTDREEAQQRWAATITAMGGDARFCRSEDDL
jgi:hypothetical protein